MPEIVKQSFYIYEICDVAKSDKTITKMKAKNNMGEYPVYAIQKDCNHTRSLKKVWLIY